MQSHEAVTTHAQQRRKKCKKMALGYIFVILTVIVCSNGMEDGAYVSVISKDQSLNIVPGKVFPNVAWARFSNEIDKSG